jgi:glycosyltransferase involved in cell wall biosynthesis
MKPKNILVITYWSYRDALIQTYTAPYLKIIRKYLPEGSRIFLVTLEQPRLRMSEEELLATAEELEREGLRLVPFSYSKFGLKAMAKWLLFLWRLLRLCRRERITHIHGWCTPGGSIGYILSKLTGLPLIVDSYEPHAEAMVENGAWPPGGVAFKILFFLEKLQSRHAAIIIATTGGMKAYAREKYCASLRRFYVKPACVDLKLFAPEEKKDAALLEQYGLRDKLVCVYAGKIGGIYLEREIFDFFKVASEYWGDSFRVLMLTDASAARVRELAEASGLDPSIIRTQFVAHAEVPRHMGLGDFAINPVKPVPTKRYCTSIKDGEYWAMGLPVVIPPRISDDSDIILAERIGSVITELNGEAYLRSVREIDALLKAYSADELCDKVRRVAIEYRNLSIADHIYRDIYGSHRINDEGGRMNAE